ncbi:signal peptide, CUB and EGF-like domain-containing protein 3 isoform X1 [Anoplophora glabripennis]|uniref:signal peptide, CUB and EGF-like domain-containing protein 3 isoform X1 n=1 Tax=Anoplophora glabripennis TaxID=217634 RepID=UPI000C7784B2|nr:signal peptide, CUB and EGF-like domain-containing protein 3 isoform X1 [Anoplophora glabripennis]
MHSNKTNMDRMNIANLVAPIPATSKITTLHNNITLHISIGNDTNYRTPFKRSNRCRKRKGGCTHICNPKGKIKCSCLTGFALAADQRTCLDIDECKTNNGGCEKECRNTLGTYECRCPNGLRLADDSKSCDDINECLLRNGHGPCQDTCENVFGSYKCSCKKLNGTVLGEDRHTCMDINECLKDNGGCSHNCINTLGKAFCSCPEGMELSSDWKTCQDINECEDQDISVSCPNCINTEGSYRCMDSADYQSDQPLPRITCKPLPLPPVGFITCTRDGSRKSYAKTGRERITNSPGTICKLECPDGFKLVGQYYVACGSFGKWEGKTEAQCIEVDPPTLLCPPTQIFKTSKESKTVLVKFPSPKTNISWKYVKSYPSWGRELTRPLKMGQYNINFIARDPNSKLSASCTLKIVVED